MTSWATTNLFGPGEPEAIQVASHFLHRDVVFHRLAVAALLLVLVAFVAALLLALVLALVACIICGRSKDPAQFEPCCLSTRCKTC